IHLGAIPVGRVDRYAVGRRIHDHVREPLAENVNAAGGRSAVLAHRGRHGLDHFTVDPHRHHLGVVIGGGDDLVTDGEVGVQVVLAENPVTQVDAVGVDRDVHGGAGLPEMLRAPT